MERQAHHSDKALGREFWGYGDGQLKVIARVLSGLQVEGEGIGHKNESTPSRNERWMVNELRAPQIGYRRDVRVLRRADGL